MSDTTIGLACSFCGKSSDEVHNLVSGPGVCICDVCVRLCVDIVSKSHEGEQGLVLLHELSRSSDVLVARLKEQGMPWDRIKDALTP